MDKVLYKYSEDFGRMGSLSSVFVATKEEVAEMLEVEEIYLGEVLGKHSDIVAIATTDTIVEITDDQEFIDKAFSYGILPSGVDIYGIYQDRVYHGFYEEDF